MMRHATVARMALVLICTPLLVSCSQDEGQASGKAAAPATDQAMMEMHGPGMGMGQGTAIGEQGMKAQETQLGDKSGEDPSVAASESVSGSGNEVHEVKAAVTRFVPMVLFIQPGDTVHWVNMAGHNTHSIEGMIPPDAEKWESALGEDYSRRFTVPGVYVYKCVPHASLGMEGVVVVGEGKPSNLDKIINSPLNKGMIGRAIRKLNKALSGRDG